MLEPISESLLGDGGSAGDVAVLGVGENRGLHRLVGLEVACHAGMMPESPTPWPRPRAYGKKRRAEARRDLVSEGATSELHAHVRVQEAAERVVRTHPGVVVAGVVGAARETAVHDEWRVFVGDVVDTEAEVDVAPDRYRGREVDIVVRRHARGLRVEKQRAARRDH